MCLSTVMTRQGRTICKNVASVTEKDGQLVFTDIMGIPTVVPGAIERSTCWKISSPSVKNSGLRRNRQIFPCSPALTVPVKCVTIWLQNNQEVYHG